MVQTSAIINVMTKAALKAGRGLLHDFGEVENLQVSQKGPADFVSAADLRADKILIEELKKARPDYSFLTEESGEIKGGGDEFCWIIDPLDGTSNFLHSFPHFSISIALEKKLKSGKSEIVAGVIYAPLVNEIYFTEKGQGAFLNDRRIFVSARKNMQEALITTGIFKQGSEDNHKKQLSMVAKFTGELCSVRIMGSAALELAYVAAGRCDGFFHTNLKPWDYAAGILMVKEARGKISTLDNRENILVPGSIIAANDSLHSRIEELLLGS